MAKTQKLIALELRRNKVVAQLAIIDKSLKLARKRQPVVDKTKVINTQNIRRVLSDSRGPLTSRQIAERVTGLNLLITGEHTTEVAKRLNYLFNRGEINRVTRNEKDANNSGQLLYFKI